jgi:hypothetical protein
MKDTDSMQKVFELSLKEIEVVLEGNRKITDKTKLAANTLSNYSRIKSTEIHEQALRLMAQRSQNMKSIGEYKEV